ncbi:hypothetical protein ABVT39_016897 [Epinephelus coioides]
MFSLRLLFLTKSTQKQISKPETCGLVKSALAKQFPLVFISAWSENSVTSLSVFSSHGKHFDSMLSLRLLFLTKSTQKQISKPETCGLVKSALAKQFPLVFISAWSENSVTSLSVFSSHGKHFDSMLSLRLLFLTKSTQKQISKPETCGLVKSALAKQFPLVFISAWSENSVTSLSVFSSHGKHFDIMFSLRLLFLTKSTQKQISKPETCGLVKSALAKQFPLVFISAWSENSVTSLSVFSSHGKHFDSMLSLRLLFLTKSTQKQISKPETCGLVKSALAKQFPLVFISAWSENSVTSLSVFSSHGKHFDSMLSLRLLFLTKSTQKQISKPETCGLVKSALAKQFPLVFISAWSENSVTSLSVFSSHGKHFDSMLSLRLLFLTKSTQKQISKPETCGLVKSALAKQFPLVFISAWSENSVTSLSVFSSHGKHFDSMLSLRLLFLTKSTQKQISKPETCGLVKSALAKQFPLVFISAWSENSVTSLSVFSSHGKHFDSMLSLRLLFLTKSTQKQISKPETCGLVKSALAKQFPLVFISAWSENSVTSLSVFSSHGKHFDIMFSLRLLFLTKSTQKQISKPETCGLVKSALAKQFPLVFISAWSENSVTSLSVFSSHGKHFDIMFSLRLLFLTKSTQKQISKPETCGLVKSALAKQFPLVFISAWSENSVTSLSVFSSHGKHFDSMLSLRLLFLTKSTQKQISKPETCGLVKSALAKQFPLVFISAWSENSVTSLSVFSSHGKHFDSMLSLRLLFLTKSTQKQISKPETCGLVKSALAKQFPLVFISAWSENSVTSLSVFSSHGKHFDIMLSLRLLFLTKSTQKQISKPETCGLVKSALAKQFPLVFISAWSENSVTSLSVFSSHGKHFDSMLSLRLLFLTKSTQKQISKPETCGLVKSALAKQFPLVFISAWSENSVTSLSVFSSHGKHFDIMFSLRLLFLTKSTQKQISKPETCGLVKSALAKQFPLVFISAWSENSVTSLSVFSSHGKHFDSMLSLRLLFLTKSTQKQISKPETCGLVKSALAKQFPLVFISAWSENSVTSLSVFSRPEKHFDSMLSLRLLFLTKSTQKQISKPETCGLVKSALAKQFPLVFISAWSENSVTSLSVFSSHGKHFDIMFSLRLLFLTKSTQKQISKPETCGLVKSALAKQFPLVFISAWSENSVTSLSVFSRPEKHFDSMLSLRLLFLTKSTQKQISKPETCGLVKSALAKQFPLVFISAWSENSVTSLSVFSSHGKHFDIMFSLRLLFLTKSTQKQISKPETCGLVKSALAKQFPLVFISAWSENSVTSLSVFSSHGKHFDIMFSLRLLFLTKSTQKQISKPETCGLVKSALSKQFPLVFISAWSENSVTSLSVFSRPEKHFDSMLSLRLLFLTKSTQKQISKPETCGLVKSALAKQFPLVFISAWSENSVTSLSVFSSPGKHFDSMLSLRLLFLTKSTQKQISKPETCGLVKSALAKQFPLVFISAWSENSVTSLSVFSSHGKHFDSMLSLRLLFLTKSTQKQISKPETCGLVKSALAKQFPLVFISAWSENSVTSLSVFSSHGKHFDIMFSLRLLFLTKSTQKQISKPETCGLVKSALAKQFPLVFISAWSENSVTSLSVFSSHGKHFDIMFSLRLLFLTKSTQKQISKPETCGLVKSALSKQFPLVFISAWSENSVTSLSVFSSPEKHFDSMLSLRLLFLTKSTQKQISKPETCGLVKSALAKQFPLVFISAWSENSVTSLSVFSSHGKHFDSMLSLRLLFLTKSTQKQISKPETCGLVKSALAKQFPLVFISAWSENSVTSLSVFSSHGKHFDSMLSLRLLFLTKSTQKQISKPETCGLVKSALAKQFPLVFISAWSENSVTSLSVFSSHGKHFDSMLSLRLLFLTKSTQKQISKPETCGLVKSALAKQFPLVFISAWSENSVTSLSVFSSHGKHFDIMFSLRLLFLTKSTQKQISKPETCGLVKSALAKQFPLVFISAWSENSVTSLSVFSSHGKHFDIMFSLRLLFLTKSTQKQISKPETCGLVKSALSKQFPLVFISAWSENSVTSLSVFSRPEKHFDSMLSLRLLFLTKSTQKQISKPETCGLVKSALAKQFPLVFISAWSENSVTSLSVFSSHGKHFDIMFSLRLLFLTKSTQKQISKPETCGLVKSALAKQFPLVFISAWSENSVTSLSVFSSHGKHFDIMFSLRLLFLTKSTQKQISKPETCGLVKSALAKQFPLVFISAWSENSVTSLSVFSSHGKHFDSMLSLRLLFLTKSTQKQISKPETCGLVKSALAKQFPLVFISAWSENSVTSLSVFSSHGKHFDIMFSLRLLFLTKSTQKQISKPETCGLVKSALAKQFPLVFISAWSENSVTSLSVFSSHGKHFDIMFSLRLLFLTKSTQKQISKPETCGLVKSALSKQFPLVFISAWSENSVTSLSVFSRPEKHFDSMLSLRLLFLTKSTQKQISKPETCGLVKSALAKQFPLVFISAWSENSVTSLSVFSSHGKHFDSMLSLRLLFLTKSTQKQISKPETCGLVKSALAKQFPLVFISAWSENSVTSLSVFSSHGKHFDSMLSLRLLFLTKSTQKQISKPETCGLVKSALSKQFPLVFISAWSENSVTSLSVFSRPEKHFDSMLSLRLLFLTKSTQKQISKPETCGLVKSALAKQFPLVFISAWSENSVTSLSVFSSHGKHFDIMFSLRLLFLTKSTQKQISKPETCGLVKSALAKQFPLVFISAWSENSVTSLSVFSSHGKHFDIMFSLRLLFLTKSTQKQISKPETCGLVKSALAKQFPLVFISAWSENSVTSLSVFSSHGKHFDSMLSLRLLFLTKSTQKQISKPETCGLVKSALAKQFPLVFISAWSENSVTSLSVFARPEKHFDSMLSLRLLFLTKSTQKQISKPETCGLVKSALAKQFPLVFISAWSENSVTSLSVFSSHGKHFDIMFSLRLLFLTKSTQKQISKPETCGLVKSALAKQFPLVFISAWSENSVTSLSVFSSHGKHFDSMLSLRLLFLTKSTQKQISKPETCGLVKSALAKQFPLVFISAWSENSVTSLSVFSSHGKHFDIMFSLRLLFLTKSTQKQISKPETCGLVKSALSKQFPLVFISAWLLFLTKSTQKQISKPETCGLVKSALAKQFPLVFISAWSENSVTSLSVFSSHGKHFDIMLSLRLLFLTKSTQKQISKPETCGLVKSALAKQFPLVFISAWSENSVTSLSVFSSHGKHFDIMFSLRLLFLTKSTQKQISKPETCGLVKSALAKQFPLVFISAWSENSVTSLSVFSSHGKHFDSMFSLRLLFLTKSTQKQISKPETCGLVKSALAKQFPLVFISAWSENSVTSLSVFSSHGKHFDIMFSLRLLFLTKSTQKQISKPETCGLVKSALAKQFPLVFISAWSENSVTSLSVFSSPGKHFDSMLSLRLLFLTKSTQKQISKPETCGLVKSALAKQFPLVFISAWSENSVTSLSVFSSHGKHFDIMFSLRLLFLTKSTQKQISKPETCGLVKSALAKQFPLVFISAWSENSVTSLSVFSSPGKHFDSMLSLRLLFLTKSTQKQISKPETCGLVKSALAKQFPLVFISAWSENSVTSLSVFSSHGKHFDSMLSLRLLFLTKSTQKQISKPETCGLVKSALAKQFPLVFISAWSENSVTSLSVFSSHGKHFDIMFSLRLLFLTKSTQKQISKPETCGLVKSALAKQFPLVFISAWSENSVTSLSVFSSHGKHFDSMLSLRLLFLTKSTQKQISKPETCGLVKSALAKQFPLVFISAWSENSVTSLSVFSSHGKHFDIMFSLRLLFLTKSTQKQISKPETCGLVKSALAKQFPLVFISAWSENSVTSLSVFSSHGKHFDIMFSLRLLFLTKSTQKQISKPETCGLVKSALAKQFPLVFISAWSENSVTSLSVFSSHGKHFDIMFSLRLLFLTKSTQKQISKPETCGLVKSALSKQFPLVFISAWSENSVTSLSVFSSPGKHFDSMLSLRLLFLTKSTQKQISKPETCGLVKSALAKQFPLVFISAWSENSVTSLSVFSSHGKHFDSMLSLRLLFLTKSTQKQISKPETCGLVKSALAKQFPLVFISAWSENSVTSLSVFSSHGKHFDSMLSLRLLFLTKSTQKQISKPETCGLVKSALAKQFPLVFISAWSENSVTSLSVFSSHGKHFDIMFSLRLLFLTKSTQKQISKPETCGLVKSALSKQFPLVFISAWSENSVTSLSVFSSHEKHFDSMLSLRLLFLTKSTQKQISKPETCGLVKSALAKQFPLVFISAWSENSVTSLSVFSSHGKHFDSMLSLRLLFLTKSTQKQISKPETCGLVKSALAKQFPLVFISAWSENSVTSLSVFSSHGKHFDIMFSLRLLFLTKSTQKQISKPETCGLVKSALAKQFPLVFISAWSENSVTSLSVFSSHGKHFDSMLSLRLLFLTKSTQKQISKPETCGLVKSALAKQFPLVFISAWSENSVTSLSVFSSHGKHFDSMLSLRLLFLTKSTQKQISKPETCGLVKSALAKQFPLVFISAWSENSVTSLSVFSSHGKHFDSMLSLRLLFLTKSTQKQISKPETCGLVKSALAKQFPLVFISAWSENSVTSLSVFSSHGKHFDSMLSLRLLFLTKSTQKQISKPETCGLVKSALAKQFPLVFISAWSENSVTSLSVFSSHGKHFDSMLSLRLLFLTKSTQKQISKPETCGLVKSALAKQFPLVFISAWSENSVTSLSVFSSHGKHFDIMFSLRLLFLTKSTQKQISKPETCGLVKSALSKQFPLVFISAWSENSVTSLSVFSKPRKAF